MPSPYEANKRWRQSHRSTYQAGKKRNYGQTSYAPNHGAPWTDGEDELVLAHETTDRELSAKIGRSVQAIQIRRARLNERTDIP